MFTSVVEPTQFRNPGVLILSRFELRIKVLAKPVQLRILLIQALVQN